VASAVLLRAGAPIEGLDAMWTARPAARREHELCNGPAKLCQALGLDRAHDGADLARADRGVTIVDDGTAPPLRPEVSARIGLSAGVEHPWRWFVPGDPNVSRHRVGGRRGRARSGGAVGDRRG
jgi:DNA-3-methyladenine glycosylase